MTKYFRKKLRSVTYLIYTMDISIGRLEMTTRHSRTRSDLHFNSSSMLFPTQSLKQKITCFFAVEKIEDFFAVWLGRWCL
jgi:hypothetical protein